MMIFKASKKLGVIHSFNNSFGTVLSYDFSKSYAFCFFKCWPTTSETGVAGMKLEVETFIILTLF